MKLFLITIVLTVATTGMLLAQGSASNGSTAAQNEQNSPSAQSAQPGTAAANRNLRIAPGSVIPVQLTKTIDAKKAKRGEEVDAHVTADLKAANGEILMPKDTKVVGKVTEAEARKQQKASEVAIEFDHAVMKDGQDMPLPMSIQAVISQTYLSGGNNGNNNAAAQNQAQSPPAPGNGGMSPGSRLPGMGAPPTENPAASAGEEPANIAATTHPPITGQTQGVLGIQDLTLSSAPAGTQGSLLTSDKHNVKLEGGTLMLLRVNQQALAKGTAGRD
jgi:hypothetical protein